MKISVTRTTIPTTDAPADDEFEVSLFGPGKGESVVVHIGGGKWVIVDSCTDRGSTRPISLEYLERLGVDVSHQVVSVIATHWHDDHIRGLGQIVEAATSARFVCSVALRHREAIEMVLSGTSAQISSAPSGVDEMGEVLRHIRERTRADRFRRPTFAQADLPLLDFHASKGHPFDAYAVALSPSNETIFKSIVALVGNYENAAPKRAILSPGANETSVVVWFTFGQISVLLGGDLEHTADPASGWNAVVAQHNPERGRAAIFKVPHHGSENADCDAVWSNLLDTEVAAILTTYTAGKTARPSTNDLERIIKRTPNRFVASQPKLSPGATRRGVVGRMARRRITGAARGNCGHIRIRSTVRSENSKFTLSLQIPAEQF